MGVYQLDLTETNCAKSSRVTTEPPKCIYIHNFTYKKKFGAGYQACFKYGALKSID